jgi:hypothetical protein
MTFCFVPAICDEGDDGLTLCEQLSYASDLHSFVMLTSSYHCGDFVACNFIVIYVHSAHLLSPLPEMRPYLILQKGFLVCNVSVWPAFQKGFSCIDECSSLP